MQIGCSLRGGNEVILIRGGKLQADVKGYNKGGVTLGVQNTFKGCNLGQ